MVISHMELGIGEIFLRIAQHAHPFPTAPLVESRVDIGDTLSDRLAVHPVIAVDREFAALLQITVGLDQGIDFLNRRIAFQLSDNETGGLTVARLGIIVVEGQQVVQLITHDTQQVVVEIVTVRTLFDEGLIGILLHLG